MTISLPSPGISMPLRTSFPLAGRGGGSGSSRRMSFTICSGVTSLEMASIGSGVVKDFERNLRMLYGTESEEEKKKQDFYVSTGYAIRTLREEFPLFFDREPSFDIYREDIVFKDPVNTFSGIENYKTIFWALRLNGRMLFKALWVDVASVWQPEETMLIVRFTAHGVPRISLGGESHSRFDGTSEYKFDKDGKIYEHKVHNIALNGPQGSPISSVDQLILSIGCPSTLKPSCFQSADPPPPPPPDSRCIRLLKHEKQLHIPLSGHHLRCD